jgi:hypothetical protein
MDDLEGFHSRKLGRLNVENSLVEKLVLTESLGIEVWEIFHSLKSSKLRPHFKTVFFNGSFATQANFDTLKKFITVKVPAPSCMTLLESLWVKQDMPQYGTNTAGEAMMVETADGFLTPKDPECRFLGISGGVVFKGLNEWRFSKVNSQTVEKDSRPNAVGNTFKREGVDPCDWTLLPPQYSKPRAGCWWALAVRIRWCAPTSWMGGAIEAHCWSCPCSVWQQRPAASWPWEALCGGAVGEGLGCRQ